MTTIIKLADGGEWEEISALEYNQGPRIEFISLWIGRTNNITYYKRVSKKPETEAEKVIVAQEQDAIIQHRREVENRIMDVYKQLDEHKKRLKELETATSTDHYLLHDRISKLEQLLEAHSHRLCRVEQSTGELRPNQTAGGYNDPLLHAQAMAKEQSAPQKQVFVKIREALNKYTNRGYAYDADFIRDIEAALGEG